MEFPLPADAPVTLPAGLTVAVHVKVVLAVPLEREILVVPLEQMICEDGEAKATGVGYSEIVMQPDIAEQSTPLKLNVTTR